MALNAPAPRIGTNRYLDGLLIEVERLARCVAAAPDAERRALAAVRLSDGAQATLVLDGADGTLLPTLGQARRLLGELAGATEPAAEPSSPSPTLTSPAPGQRSGAPATRRDAPATRGDAPSGTWLDAFGIAHEPTDSLVRAREIVGAAAGLDADDLTFLGEGGVDALRDLHGRLTAGLVAADRAGAERTVAQAVHDASVGRVIHLTCEPDTIGDELSRLGTWLRDEAPNLHPVLASGALHGEVLRIHPFDAANGRLARTAARLMVRNAGLDPDGLACPEPVLASDPMGYHQAMADTLRRRDLTRWIERWAEALAAGLRQSARTLDALDIVVPDRAAAFATTVGANAAVAAGPGGEAARGGAFTLADYLAVVDGDREAAASDLAALLDAGVIARVLGSHGLRFVVRRLEAHSVD